MATDSKQKITKSMIDGKLASYGATKKSLYSALGLIGCLFLIVVLSFTGAGFKPEVFATWEYWVKIAINYAIAIYSMIAGRQIGDDTQRNKPDGQYRLSLNQYHVQYTRLDNGKMLASFEPWLETYKDRKRVEKIHNVMKEWRIFQTEVLDLDITELDNLRNPYKKDWTGTEWEGVHVNKKGESVTYFKSLSEEQIAVVRAILSGKVVLGDVNATFFVNALTESSIDQYERAATVDKKKGAKLGLGYSFKLVMMLAISFALNGIYPDPYDQQTGARIWMDLAVRVFTMLSSLAWGVNLGSQVVAIDREFLDYKTSVLKQCGDEIECGKYKIDTTEEAAKREYDEYRKENPEVEAELVQDIISLPAPK